MRVLLISPNTLTSPYPVYPIGLDYVAGAVADRHQVRIADMNSVNREDLARIISEFSPEIIGLSCRNIDNTDAGQSLYFVNNYKDFIAWLRIHSQALIVCGGSGFTIMPAEIFTTLGADYGIIGEGERFGPLVDALESGRDVTDLPGVISSPGQAHYPPPWDGEQNRKFGGSFPHYHYYLKKGGMLNLQTKRGCSFLCIYCPYPHIEGRTHRLLDPAHVARTAMELQEAGAKYLFVTDSIFNSDVNHSLEVALAFKKAGVTVPWGGFFAPVKLPADYFSVMKDAGLRHVEFGTESLSDRMLKAYRKPFRTADVFTAHRQARESGLHVAHYFLFGGPGESTATIKESLNNAEQLKKTVLFFFTGIRIYPHTALYDLALAEGKITPETNLLEPVFYSADEINLSEIEELVRKQADKRINWVLGSGGPEGAATINKLHEREYTGPLWEFLAK